MSLTLIQQHLTEMDFAFQNVVKYILRRSTLTISLIRINSITEDSFHVSIEARTTNTGPASATLSSFTIDLCGPAGRFGQVHLPAITTHSDGAPIIVTEQLVQILDKAALQAFIQPVIVADRATLVLRNGNTAVKALGVGPKPICYEKDIPMSGMLGPRIRVHDATHSKASEGGAAEAEAPLTVTVHVANPSPMELSFGLCALEIQNAAGETFATLQGDLDIKRDRFEAVFRGAVNRDVKIGQGSARLVGMKCMGAGWCDETVRQINTPLIGMGKVFEALDIAHEEEVQEEEEKIREMKKEGDLTTTTTTAASEKAAAAGVLEEPLKAASKLWHGRFWRTQVS